MAQLAEDLRIPIPDRGNFTYYFNKTLRDLSAYGVSVAIGSLADKAGLKAGDIVIKMNGEPIQQLTHSQVHDKIVKAGKSLVLSVVRDLPVRKVQRDTDDYNN